MLAHPWGMFVLGVGVGVSLVFLVGIFFLREVGEINAEDALKKGEDNGSKGTQSKRCKSRREDAREAQNFQRGGYIPITRQN